MLRVLCEAQPTNSNSGTKTRRALRYGKIHVVGVARGWVTCKR